MTFLSSCVRFDTFIYERLNRMLPTPFKMHRAAYPTKSESILPILTLLSALPSCATLHQPSSVSTTSVSQEQQPCYRTEVLETFRRAPKRGISEIVPGYCTTTWIGEQLYFIAATTYRGIDPDIPLGVWDPNACRYVEAFCRPEELIDKISGYHATAETKEALPRVCKDADGILSENPDGIITAAEVDALEDRIWEESRQREK